MQQHIDQKVAPGFILVYTASRRNNCNHIPKKVKVIPYPTKKMHPVLVYIRRAYINSVTERGIERERERERERAGERELHAVVIIDCGSIINHYIAIDLIQVSKPTKLVPTSFFALWKKTILGSVGVRIYIDVYIFVSYLYIYTTEIGVV